MGFGENLKALRRKEAARRKIRRYTQEMLAGDADVQQSDISKWESNTVTPDLASAMKVARVFRVSIDHLVVGMDPTYDAAVLSAQSLRKGAHTREGATDETATRLHELETEGHELAVYKDAVKQLRTVLEEAVALVGEESPGIAAAAPGRRSRHRKARR